MALGQKIGGIQKDERQQVGGHGEEKALPGFFQAEPDEHGEGRENGEVIRKAGGTKGKPGEGGKAPAAQAGGLGDDCKTKQVQKLREREAAREDAGISEAVAQPG